MSQVDDLHSPVFVEGKISTILSFFLLEVIYLHELSYIIEYGMSFIGSKDILEPVWSSWIFSDNFFAPPGSLILTAVENFSKVNEM